MKIDKLVKTIIDNFPVMLSKSKLEQVYRDRNLVILWAIKNFDGEKGWREHSGGMYVVVWAKTEEGNVSWHIPREMIEGTDIEKKHEPWDGHGTEEKLSRVLNLVQEEVTVKPEDSEQFVSEEIEEK